MTAKENMHVGLCSSVFSAELNFTTCSLDFLSVAICCLTAPPSYILLCLLNVNLSKLILDTTSYGTLLSSNLSLI